MTNEQKPTVNGGTDEGDFDTFVAQSLQVFYLVLFYSFNFKSQTQIFPSDNPFHSNRTKKTPTNDTTNNNTITTKLGYIRYWFCCLRLN